jgi:site-specific DNA-methyltransferase (adenine-specific)
MVNDILDFGYYNMDCIEGMKHFPDKYFDLAIVDPVYGDVTKGGYMKDKYNGKKIGTGAAVRNNYHNGLWQQDKTGQDYFTELLRVSKNQIVWGGNYFANNLPTSQCWIVWDKQHPEGLKFADVELAWTSYNRSARIFRYMWNGMLQGDMKNKEVRIHPTQKPVKLYEWLIDKFSEQGDTILDTHVGSASSLIAFKNTGHKFVGFELDPIYYEQSKKRYEEATAQMTIADFM